MAQHEGYAIAVMTDMLWGVMTGSAFVSGVAGPYQTERRSGAGQMIDRAEYRDIPAADGILRSDGAVDRRAQIGAAR